MGARHNRQCGLVPLLFQLRRKKKTRRLILMIGRDGGVCPDAGQLPSAIFALAFLLQRRPVSAGVERCWQERLV